MGFPAYTVLKREEGGERTGGDVPCTAPCFCAFFPDVRSSTTQKQGFSQTMSNSIIKINSVLIGHYVTENSRGLHVSLNSPTLTCLSFSLWISICCHGQALTLGSKIMGKIIFTIYLVVRVFFNLTWISAFFPSFLWIGNILCIPAELWLCSLTVTCIHSYWCLSVKVSIDTPLRFVALENI